MKRLALPLLITCGLLIICILMVVYPLSVWESGVRGLSIWWEVLFPSLFPFFVISELLLGLGIVHFMGTLLHPFMRPVFRIPGTGGFVAAISYASGYPVGAKLTAKLWEQKQITREEGERLVAFTTTSDPIFLIGAVAVGFFHTPALAGILAIAHYGSGLIVGLLMRFHGPKDTHENSEALTVEGNRLKHAFYAMHQARESDGRSLGQLVQQAIRSSLQLMIVVGGLVVFFSVILQLFTEAGFMNGMYHWLEQVLLFLGLPKELSQSLVGGLFEVTLGARYAGTLEGIPLIYKVAAAACILSWGGLSVHAQVVSILNSTPLRYLPFMFARAVHAILAAGIVFLCWNPIMNSVDTIYPSGFSDSAPLLTGIHLLPSQLAITIILIGGLVIITAVYIWVSQFIAKYRN
ncbi:sporulation integral membrane protein YlbJ [Paenibacillus gallinarum]|uniref:Sporulation integral membrane protein YlbJ n=1 Tax=Paenibacillus gallinarum TaxID=2762232 RepID=A0ABR8T1J3_9BACL|nr:sporulation integral membrane protein YlbJ [Paenibacillus gallinarum]MBD7969623.1 sporulation integral membrane protein YlbJ [Paenibacillus gallinarum]